jgi:hypothetical protein
MSNHVRQRDAKRGGSRGTKVPRFRSKRSKTFKSEESAKSYAEENGIKDYKLRNLKSSESSIKKIVIEY